MRYDSTRTNNSSFSDGYPGDNCNATANPYVISYVDRFQNKPTVVGK